MSDDIRVIADGFVYKNKYCALCHGFETYTPIELELLNCATSVNVSGIGMTIPDGSCNIKVPEDSSLGYKKANLDISNFSPVMDRSECSVQDFKLCFHSYFALIVISYRRKYANPYCGKCSGETELVTGNCYDYLIDKKTGILITPPLKPHFRMLISFDKDRNSNSLLDIGNPICSYNQAFDVFTSHCRNKSHDIYGEEEGIKLYQWLKQYYVYENILSIVFLAVSVILELFLLTVYVTLKKTTTAGKNLISFCVALSTCGIIEFTFDEEQVKSMVL